MALPRPGAPRSTRRPTPRAWAPPTRAARRGPPPGPTSYDTLADAGPPLALLLRPAAAGPSERGRLRPLVGGVGQPRRPARRPLTRAGRAPQPRGVTPGSDHARAAL